MILIEPRPEQLQLKQVDYTELPEYGKLEKIARLYANAFADDPWNEYKICEKKHYVGRQQWELMRSTNCSQPDCGKLLKIAYPVEERVDYITKEVTKPKGTLITYEDESGEIFAAGWGYACTLEELQAKYDSSEIKEEVVNRIKKSAEKVQTVFYLSEILVDIAARNRGIATTITKSLLKTAQSLNLNAVMRTRSDSPMVQIAKNMQMTQVINVGEDTDNSNRVLYIKI
jgi:hypothetical protein